MSIAVDCGHCKASFRVKDDLGGRRGKCPRCGAVIEVPLPARPVATAESGTTPAPTAVAKTPAATRPAAPPAARITPATLAAAFGGDVPPIRPAVAYRLGIVVVSLVMVLLPLCYMALIGLVALGLYYHAVHDIGIVGLVRGRAAVFALLVYLAPLVAGAILILFMIKPLFARPAGQDRIRSITPRSDPLLFAFVARLCEVVGAPMPRRIDVNVDVNASASFRRGLWSVLWGNDLVLTIGLPLAAGLDLRQFAGVLAHEFGHFSQGAGMRLTYVIRAISYWLTRVVYERDEWDERLAAWAEGTDVRLAIVLHFTRLCVWATRRVLWVFMMVGHAVAGMMLRQMEFDADRQETWLAGSDAFETTSRRIAVLAMASQGAQADLGCFYQEGRLGDNLTRLIMANVDQIPKDALAALEKHLDEATTGWLDTHPCHKARLESARREHAPGIFRLDLPATVLFGDFDHLSREATWDYYRSIFGPRFKPADMHPIDDLLARQNLEKEAVESLERYCLGRFSPIRPVPLPGTMLAPPDNPREMAQRLRGARARMEAARPAYDEAFARFDKADDRQVLAIQGQAQWDAFLCPAQAAGDVSMTTLKETGALVRRAAAEIREAEPGMVDFERALGERLYAALELLDVPKVAARLDRAREWQSERDRLFPVLVALEEQRGELLTLRQRFLGLVALLGRLQGNEENEKLIRTIRKHLGLVYRSVADVRRELVYLQYPFDHAEKGISVGKFAVKEVPGEEDLGAICEAAQSLLEKVVPLRARVVARLAYFAERVEGVLGLKPLARPPSPPAKPSEERTP